MQLFDNWNFRPDDALIFISTKEKVIYIRLGNKYEHNVYRRLLSPVYGAMVEHLLNNDYCNAVDIAIGNLNQLLFREERSFEAGQVDALITVQLMLSYMAFRKYLVQRLGERFKHVIKCLDGAAVILFIVWIVNTEIQTSFFGWTTGADYRPSTDDNFGFLDD